MSDMRLGKRYADGLYDAARADNKVEEVAEALQTLRTVFDSVPELVKFWGGSQVAPAKKRQLTDKVFKDIPDIVRNLLNLLIDNKRENAIFDIFVAFALRRDEEMGIVRATLTTAVELQDAETVPFIKYLKARHGDNVELKRKVDEKLVAGFRLHYGNRIIDASVERSINEIRRRVSA